MWRIYSTSSAYHSSRIILAFPFVWASRRTCVSGEFPPTRAQVELCIRRTWRGDSFLPSSFLPTIVSASTLPHHPKAARIPSPMSNFEALPNELLARVIGFLNKKSLAEVRLVNKRLEQISVERLFARNHALCALEGKCGRSCKPLGA